MTRMILADPSERNALNIVVKVIKTLHRFFWLFMMSLGLLVMIGLSIFAFDLDAMFRFLFRLSSQYVEADVGAQKRVRWAIMSAGLVLTVVLIIRMFLDAVSERLHRRRERPS